MRAALALCVFAAGCNPYDEGSYTCDSDAQCGGSGLCAGGLCSFPDPACSTGYRFAALAGDRSRACVACLDGDMPATFATGGNCAPWGGTTQTNGATVVQADGFVVITPSAQANSYAGCTGFNFPSFARGAFIEVADVPSAAATSAYSLFEIYDTAQVSQFRATFIAESGTLGAFTVVGGTQTTLPSVPFDPVAHRYWRFRTAGAELVAETSPDAGTWTRFGGFNVSAPAIVKINLGAGTASAEAAPGRARFGDFNRCP